MDKPTLVIFYSGKGEAARIDNHTDFELYCKKLKIRYFVVSIINYCQNSNKHLSIGEAKELKRKICDKISPTVYKLPYLFVMDKNGLFDHIDFKVACYQYTLTDDKIPSYLNNTPFGKCQIDWKPDEEKKSDKIKRIRLKSYVNVGKTEMDKIKIDFSKVVVPPMITNKPKKERAIAMASMYKKKLFDNQYPRKKHFGGWLILAVKNHKICENKKMLSLSQLGFTFRKTDIIKQVLNNNITITSCIGTTNSPYSVVMNVVNNTANRIRTLIPRGQVFEQNQFRRVQNLAIAQDTQVEIPPNGTANVRAEALCIDMNHSCCHGEEMNITPYTRTSMQEEVVQGDEWAIAANVEENSLY